MRFLIILALVLVLYYMLRSLFHPRAGEETTHRAHPDVGRAGGNELVKDPYCQTYIPINTAFRGRMDGENLFFCSEECMNRYLQEKKGRSSKVG